MKKIRLKNRVIGPGEPTFIIAEMSGNHNHSFEKAKKIIDKAAEIGADAIKLQTYTADTMTIDCDNKYFQVNVNDKWKGRTLYELYQWAYTPWDWQPKLKKYAESKGLIFFSTPFDETAVDFLEEIDVELYKVASFEINHIPLLKKIASTKKPVIISRGVSSQEDIYLAVKTLKDNGSPSVAVLHCVSSYPADPEQMNLKTITDISKRFDVVAGLSDHSLSSDIPVAAVALGARIIEKHIILKRAEGVPDAAFSLETEEFKKMVDSVRNVEKALGKVTYNVTGDESKMALYKRSIFIIKDIKEGEKISKNNIKVIRPGNGMHPKYYKDVIGKIAQRNLFRGTPLKNDDIK